MKRPAAGRRCSAPCAGKQIPERLVRAGLAAGVPGAAIFCGSLDVLIIN